MPTLVAGLLAAREALYPYADTDYVRVPDGEVLAQGVVVTPTGTEVPIEVQAYAGNRHTRARIGGEWRSVNDEGPLSTSLVSPHNFRQAQAAGATHALRVGRRDDTTVVGLTDEQWSRYREIGEAAWVRYQERLAELQAEQDKRWHDAVAAAMAGRSA